MSGLWCQDWSKVHHCSCVEMPTLLQLLLCQRSNQQLSGLQRFYTQNYIRQDSWTPPPPGPSCSRFLTDSAAPPTGPLSVPHACNVCCFDVVSLFRWFSRWYVPVYIVELFIESVILFLSYIFNVHVSYFYIGHINVKRNNSVCFLSLIWFRLGVSGFHFMVVFHFSIFLVKVS